MIDTNIDDMLAQAHGFPDGETLRVSREEQSRRFLAEVSLLARAAEAQEQRRRVLSEIAGYEALEACRD